MFGFGKKKHKGPYGSNYQHIAARSDWDVLNRELFYEVMDKWPSNALALITNTRNHDSNLSRPYVQMRSDVDPDMGNVVNGLSSEQFNKIYQLAKKSKPENTDCFRVKNLGLPNNSLAFLIENSKGQYRTILVFGGQRIKGELEKRLELVTTILSAKARGKSAEQVQAAATASATATAAYSNDGAIREADTNDLIAREEFLEDKKDQLDYAKRVEFGKIQAELKKRGKG